MDGVSTWIPGAAVLFMNRSRSEVKVLESGYQAEYGSGAAGTGRHQGGTTVPRLGLQRAAQFRLEREQHANSSGVPKLCRRHRTSGSRSAALGKPGGHNKLFFFYAEGSTQRPPEAAVDVPAADRAGAAGRFLAATDNLGSPIHASDLAAGVCGYRDRRSPVLPGRRLLGRIPADRLSVGLNILKMYPLPNNRAPRSETTSSSSRRRHAPVPSRRCRFYQVTWPRVSFAVPRTT